LLKKESRILAITKVNQLYIGVVLRGVKGFENIVLFSSCKEIHDFLKSRRDIAGEISYLIEIDSDCNTILAQLKLPGLHLLDSSSIPNMLKSHIDEAIRIARLVGIRMLELQIKG